MLLEKTSDHMTCGIAMAAPADYNLQGIVELSSEGRLPTQKIFTDLFWIAYIIWPLIIKQNLCVASDSHFNIPHNKIVFLKICRQNDGRFYEDQTMS